MKRRRSLATFVVPTAIAIAACAGGATAPAAPSAATQAAPSMGGATATPMVSVSTGIVLGGSRPVTVHLPPGAGTEPAPLLLVIHGLGSSGAAHEEYFGLDREAAARGIVIAYPDGTRNRDGNRFWNATDACCNFYEVDVDDVGYLVSLVYEVSRVMAIDPRRVYLVGHSNGGFMSYRVACEQAGLFAAIVSLAGATYDDETDCAPSAPVAVLQIHGSADDTVMFGGGTLRFGGTAPPRPYPGAKATVAAWALYDGCQPAFETLPESLDIDAVIDGPNGPTETKRETAKGCRPGGAVELWTIQGGSHVPNLSSSFASDVIDFLLAHPQP